MIACHAFSVNSLCVIRFCERTAMPRRWGRGARVGSLVLPRRGADHASLRGDVPAAWAAQATECRARGGVMGRKMRRLAAGCLEAARGALIVAAYTTGACG